MEINNSVHQCAINTYWPDETVFLPEDPKGNSGTDPMCGVSWLIMWRIISYLTLRRSFSFDVVRCSH